MIKNQEHYFKYIGMRYNRLTILEIIGKNKFNKRMVSVRCDCGVIKNAIFVALVNGYVKSCGCAQKEIASRAARLKRTHGLTKSPTYNAWDSMKARCLNKKHKSYKDYGQRGIKICERWMLFENFLNDMGLKPEDMSLDRIDNSLGYYKENCKWSSYREQSNNKRNNIKLEINGKTHTIIEAAKYAGITPGQLYQRLQRGWTKEESLDPADGRSRRKKRGTNSSRKLLQKRS